MVVEELIDFEGPPLRIGTIKARNLELHARKAGRDGRDLGIG